VPTGSGHLAVRPYSGKPAADPASPACELSKHGTIPASDLEHGLRLGSHLAEQSHDVIGLAAGA
jgi:hypothetical protein